MNQAAAVLAMLCMVAATVGTTRLGRPEGLVAVVGACGVSLGVLSMLGGDVGRALSSMGPLLMLAGYAAVSEVLTETGTTTLLLSRLGDSPVWVLVLAAVASVFLSNDVVVVALAPVVLLRPSGVVDAAALFVGANVTGGLLPQGSPTNLLLLGDRDFYGYTSLSALPTAAMLAVAVAVFTVAGRAAVVRRPLRGDGTGLDAVAAAPPVALGRVGPHGQWTAARRGLVALAVAAVVAQPVADLVGVPRVALGWGLLMVAAAVAVAVGLPVGQVMSRVPWQVGAVVLVLSVGAALLAGTSPVRTGVAQWAVTTFFVSAVGTDILAAALAAPSVLAGAAPPAVSLVAVTAGAFATPVASVSGILLLSGYREAHRRPSVRSFALAGGCAVACWVAGTAVAVLVG